jgi:hypothetical protein
MPRSERRSELALALVLLGACGGDQRPPRDLRRDAAALLGVLHDDRVGAHVAEAERIADARPVHAAGILARAAIPAAQRQVERARDAELTTPEGRALASRLRAAYEERARGLETWRRYLEDAATDDERLLEATSAMRRAELSLLALDRELTALERDPASTLDRRRANVVVAHAAALPLPQPTRTHATHA